MYLITLKKCSRYLGYYCCTFLTSLWDFGPLLNCLSAQLFFEKIRWCCWNYLRTDEISKWHISTFHHKSQHPSQSATLSVTNCNTVKKCEDHKLLRNRWMCVCVSVCVCVGGGGGGGGGGGDLVERGLPPHESKQRYLMLTKYFSLSGFTRVNLAYKFMVMLILSWVKSL